MERVNFSKKQILALMRMFKICQECSVIQGEFSFYGFSGAIEAAFKSLEEDRFLVLNTPDDSE